MRLMEQNLQRIKILRGCETGDAPDTLLGYKIGLKNALAFAFFCMAASLLLIYPFAFFCYLLMYISDAVSDFFAVIFLAFLAVLNSSMLLLAILSLIKQPRYFFIDMRDKKIIAERGVHTLESHIDETTLLCGGHFIKLVDSSDCRYYPNRINTTEISLFAPMGKGDRENLICLIKSYGGSFVCANSRCKQCCNLDADLKLKKTIDEEWEELSRKLNQRDDMGIHQNRRDAT